MSRAFRLLLYRVGLGCGGEAAGPLLGPAGEVVSTAAGGTGQSESRNKALVLNASMAVGP